MKTWLFSPLDLTRAGFIPAHNKALAMSAFLESVIDCLNRDDFLRNYREGYCGFTYCMDKDADKIRPLTQGWMVSTFDCTFFTSITLERGNNKVPLTWKEKRRLLRVFRAAMERMKKARKDYLKGLRD